MRALSALLLLAAAVGLGWVLREQTQPPPPLPPPDLGQRAAWDSLDARLANLRGALERTPQPTSDEENALRRPRTPSYRLHLAWADSLGVPPVGGEADLTRHLRAGRLVPLHDTEHYQVRTLEHSKPFVTPELSVALDELGRRFHARLAERGLPPYRFVVTSALRTADLQADLRSSNRNATSGTSSHEFGASVDVVTFRYALQPSAADTFAVAVDDPDLGRAQRAYSQSADDLGRAYWDRLFGELTRTMRSMQDDERLVVLLEAEQPVFHITARAAGDIDP